MTDEGQGAGIATAGLCTSAQLPNEHRVYVVQVPVEQNQINTDKRGGGRTAAPCRQPAARQLAILSAAPQPKQQGCFVFNTCEHFRGKLYLRLRVRRFIHSLLPKILNSSLDLRRVSSRAKEVAVVGKQHASYDPWSLFALKKRAKLASSCVCPASRSSITLVFAENGL